MQLSYYFYKLMKTVAVILLLFIFSCSYNRNNDIILDMNSSFLKKEIIDYCRINNINKHNKIVLVSIRNLEDYNLYTISSTINRPINSHRSIISYQKINGYLVLFYFNNIRIFNKEIMDLKLEKEIANMGITLSKRQVASASPECFLYTKSDEDSLIIKRCN